VGSIEHRRAWETGHIEYTGRDCYSHIQQQIERYIDHLPPQYHPSQQRQNTPERQQTPEKPASILKKPSQQTIISHHENSQSLVYSNIPIEKSTSTNEQELISTGKSIIVTDNRQSTDELTGLTPVTELVSQSSASSSGNLQNIMSNQQNTEDGKSVQDTTSLTQSKTNDDKNLNK
ncbi:unnamed protein product, partial [Rotaria sp. Silwood2]